ncbi:MAG: hypothetical protein M5U26_03535 [Planctomycetota bacterium]|nr:hypothetical protein [Planctomycetota bacterium]
MAAFTFSDAKTFLSDWNKQDQSDKALRQYARIANASNVALRQCGPWQFEKRLEKKALQPLYDTGTVAVAVGAAVVTLTGGTFPAAAAGMFIRFNGEPQQYRVSTRDGAGQVTLEENYLGTDNLTEATYTLTDELLTLPTRAYRIEHLLLDEVTTPLQDLDLEYLQYLRMQAREINRPFYYAADWIVTSNTPALTKVWVYPAPAAYHTLLCSVFVRPAEVSGDSDVFGLPDDAEAKAALQEFLKAYLFQEQGETEKFNAQLAYAQLFARRALSRYRLERGGGQRRLHQAGLDGKVTYVARLGPYS